MPAKPTLPSSYPANHVVTSAEYNRDVLQNGLYLQGLLDGTGSDAVSFPTTAFFSNDANFVMLKSSATTPLIQFDFTDYYYYDRTANVHHIVIGGVDKLTVAANGDVTAAGALIASGDASFSLFKSGGVTPLIQFDTNDYYSYDRSANTHNMAIGGVNKLTIDANGKLTGSGIYRSAEVGIANGATANFTHGLGARPAWVGGFYNSVSGTEDSLTNPINVGVGSTGVAITTGAVTNTIITVTNGSGAGIAARVYAIL
jgi:hypothetical protein